MMRRLGSFLVVLALAGCNAPTVPDFSYYRLPRAAPLPVAKAPLFDEPIVVQEFAADGLYGDQAMVYATDPGAQELHQYHYQLWTDPPPRMLQRRLIAQLRAAHAGPRVTDELAISQAAVRIRGVILRLDRVPRAGGGYGVAVTVKLRVDAGDGPPILDERYEADAGANGTDLKSTALAFGSALDRINARFYADLVREAARYHGDSVDKPHDDG
ncbi:MAG: ABC-type transport auxiliary lipoprotein family protein [Rhodanobacteraceae bacterium]